MLERGETDTKNTILRYKLSVLSIIQVKTHEKMKKTFSFQILNKIWVISPLV